MKAVLINPPTCDPTAPYIAVPLLTACLRARGLEVLPIDANLGAWRYLLEPEALRGLLERVRNRFRALDREPSLGHALQLQYAVLAGAYRGGVALPERIRGALALLGGGQGAQFYQDEKYGQAVEAVERAQALIGAAYHPLSVSFTEYRTPFSLLSPREIALEARPERDPFQDYYQKQLIPRLRAERPGLIGLSVAFPGQLQPAFSLARCLRGSLPGTHLTAGGPALTQFLLRVPPERASEVLGSFDTAVLFEGEQALVELCDAVGRGEAPSGIVHGARAADLAALPAPDFDGLPLGEYLAPEPVLPYDAARGCYWGRCAFCHYGLAETGTAAYRERPVERAAEHLLALSAKYGCRLFYLSEDTIAPAWLLRLAGLAPCCAAEARWLCRSAWSPDRRESCR
jgi:anaerobic magnesium-protoporphyrin IX monomethyl ester cyclase